MPAWLATVLIVAALVAGPIAVAAFKRWFFGDGVG